MNTEPSGKKPSKKGVKFFKALLWIISSIILLIAGLTIFVAVFYENEVKSYLIGRINQNLKTQIIVQPGNIDLTVIKDFPYASLEFKNVTAMDAVESSKKDTLFSAGNISLKFNLIDIFKKKYRIKKIKASDMSLNIRIYKNGSDNYHFWKSLAGTDTSSFSFAMENFIFENVHLVYKNDIRKGFLALHIDDAILSGNFTDKNYGLDVKANTLIKKLETSEGFHFNEKPLVLDFKLDADSEKDFYKIKRGNIEISDLALTVTGTLQTNPKKLIDIEIKGEELHIKSILSLLPEKYSEEIKNYESTGNFYFQSLVKGEFGADETPLISANFGIDKGEITEKNSGIALKNILAKGKYSNASEGSLNISSFDAMLSAGRVKGNFFLTDFKTPLLDANINAIIRLEDLKSFLQIDTVESMSGDLNITASVKGELEKIKNYSLPGNIQKTSASGEISIGNAQINIKSSPLKVRELNTFLTIKNNELVVKDLKGKISGNEFSITGIFSNFIGYFTEGEKLNITAVAAFNDFNLDSLLLSTNDISKSESYKLRFSDRINCELKTSINKLTFRNFKAENITGAIKFANKKLTAEELSFTTMDGTVKANGSIDADKNNFLVACNAGLSNVNITKFFHQMENFGQEVLKDKNVKGLLTADIVFATVMDSTLNIDTEKMYAKSNITIEKGELIQFEPFKGLAEYVRKDKILPLFIEADEFGKKLEHVKFTTLKNDIEVRNKVVTIPTMEIKSSAMNIVFSGTHTFQNIIDYKFNFLLAEVLTKRQKKEAERNNEFGPVEDDGPKRTIFFSMAGPIDNPLIKYDWKSSKEKRKEDIQKEKENLKSILKEEFGWFKKDSTSINSNKEQKKDDKFIIQWDEDDKGDNEEDDF